MSNPYAEFTAEELLVRKDALMLDVVRRLARLQLEPDYAVAIMRAAAERTMAVEDRIAILETLVEIEAIKYTLAARRVRELDPEERG